MAKHGIEVRAGVKPKSTVRKLSDKIRANSRIACKAATLKVYEVLTQEIMQGTPKRHPLFLLGPTGSRLASRDGKLAKAMRWSVKEEGGVVIGRILPPSSPRLAKIWGSQQYGAKIVGSPYLKIPTINTKPPGSRTFIWPPKNSRKKTDYLWIVAAPKKGSKQGGEKKPLTFLALLKDEIVLRPRKLLEAALRSARSAARADVKMKMSRLD